MYNSLLSTRSRIALESVNNGICNALSISFPPFSSPLFTSTIFPRFGGKQDEEGEERVTIEEKGKEEEKVERKKGWEGRQEKAERS